MPLRQHDYAKRLLAATHLVQHLPTFALIIKLNINLDFAAATTKTPKRTASKASRLQKYVRKPCAHRRSHLATHHTPTLNGNRVDDADAAASSASATASASTRHAGAQLPSATHLEPAANAIVEAIRTRLRAMDNATRGSLRKRLSLVDPSAPMNRSEGFDGVWVP